MKKETVLIIGGSDGIGKEIAKRFLYEGYKVVNVSRTHCAVQGVTNLYCDCADAETIRTSIKKASDEELIVAGVYCSGYSFFAPLELSRQEDYRYLYEVNFFGAVVFMQEIIPLLKKIGGGKIFLISSVGGVSPIAYESFYSSSKAALNMLSLNMNTELNRYGINVTSVMPGGTRTNFTFRRKVYTDTGYEYFHKAAKKLYKIEQKGDEPEKVADVVYDIFQSKKCVPIVATVGIKNKLTHVLTRFSPYKLTVFLTKKVFFGIKGE